MSCDDKAYWTQLNELSKKVHSLKRAGFGPLDFPWEEVYRLRDEIIGKSIGPFPRSIVQVLRIAGLSPGILALWLDVEAGWMVEAREYEGAPPVYHLVDENTAVEILQGKNVHEYEAWFIVPATDVDQ